MPRKRSSTKPRDYFQPLDSEPPTALKNNRLAWMAGCELAGQLMTLPFGYRPSKFRKDLLKGKKLPLSVFSRDLVAARDVVTILLKHGHEAACAAFNEWLSSTTLHLPRLISREVRRGRKTWQTVTWGRQGTRGLKGDIRFRPFLSPALALWLILSEPDAHPRLLQCAACGMWFFIRTLHKAIARASGQRVYCSPRCRSRQTVADTRRPPSVS
jgi:hypothetical protein